MATRASERMCLRREDWESFGIARVGLMTLRRSADGTIGRCRLAILPNRALSYGHACARNGMDGGRARRAPGRREPLRAHRRRVVRDAGAERRPPIDRR